MNHRCSKLALAAGIVFAAASSFAGTYYIDYTNGVDSNNGTSTSSPWKRHPYMSGWAGSYSHQAGDRFIFKGGVTWPSACWPMRIPSGGSAANFDYYGVSSSWYAGVAWTRPVFDGGRAGTEQVNLATGIKYLVLDGIEFINAQQCANIECTSPSYTTITNCYIHKWYGDGLSDTWNSSVAGIRNFAIGTTLGYTNFLITHSEVGNADGDRNSGVCIAMAGELAFTKVHNAPLLIMYGGTSIHDCEIYQNNESYMTDAAEHPDVVYWAIFNGRQPYAGNCYFYNNWIHDMRGGSGVLPVLYFEAGFGPPITGEYYIYNNVFTTCTNPAVFPDNEGNTTPNIRAHVWNNTFAVTYPSAILGSYRSGATKYDLLDMRNNHVIGSSECEDGAGVFVSRTSSNSVVQTAAVAGTQGFSLASRFSPQSTNATTVGAGLNLTTSGLPGIGFETSCGGTRTPKPRPVTGKWDAGAYQLSSTPATNPVIALSYSTLNFGVVVTNTSKDLTVTVQNIGAGTLSGTVSAAAPFAVVGGGSYNLGSAQSQDVVLRYSPTTTGNSSQNLSFTGGGGASLQVNGSGGTLGAPAVTTITQSPGDVSAILLGVQAYAGSTVQYSGSAVDPNGLPLTWQWLYSVNGGPESVAAAGSNAITSVSFTYDAGTAGGSYVWKLRVSNGYATSEATLAVAVQTPPVASSQLVFQAEEGTITGPFTVENGYIYQASETTLTDSGRAAFSFTVTNAGSYVIQATLNAPDDAANSLFINVDAEPQDPYMIWDIAVTTGFETRLAGWRGNGTFDADEFSPKVFNLAAGPHQLIIRGREAGVQLDSVLILPVPASPRNLRVVAGL